MNQDNIVTKILLCILLSLCVMKLLAALAGLSDDTVSGWVVSILMTIIVMMPEDKNNIDK